jgi:hypothetical protein
MSQIFRVVAFKLLGDYVIQLQFNDNSSQTIDFEPILSGPVFGPLRDPYLFNQVVLDSLFGTLEWPNGADVDPNVLHDWPDHIKAIIAHRQERFAEAPTV